MYENDRGWGLQGFDATPCGGEVLHICLEMPRTKHPI